MYLVSKSSPKELSSSEKALIDVINSSLEKLRSFNLVKKNIRYSEGETIEIKENKIKLKNGKLYVIGWGKIADSMAYALEKVLPKNLIEEGVVISTNKNNKLLKIKPLIGSHPLPSKRNIDAAKKIVSLANKITKDDTIICLISGGGSALLTYPAKGISLVDLKKTTKTLLLNGVEDKDINIIRKHLSQVKGGKLTKLLYPARIINIFISDDPHNLLPAITSGPTFKDNSTFADAVNIIKRFKLLDKIPPRVSKYLKSNIGKLSNETVKNSTFFQNTSNIILLDNYKALKILKEEAIKKYFDKVYLYKKTFHKNINKSVKEFTRFIDLSVKENEHKNILVLAGGEIPIKVIKNGKGGRAQHFAAMMIPTIRKYKNSVFAAVASDGNDYIKGISGAIVSSRILNNNKVSGNNLEKHIKNTNSFQLHKMLNSHLLTVAPTETNVSDIFIFAHFGKDKNKV